jgi:prevent-host-death family protein
MTGFVDILCALGLLCDESPCFDRPLTSASVSSARSMAKIPTTVPVSDLRQDAARVLKHAKQSKQQLVITQRGRATAVLMSLDAYERSEAEREILLLLARGEKEIAAEVGYSLEQVVADADALLSEGCPCRSCSPHRRQLNSSLGSFRAAVPLLASVDPRLGHQPTLALRLGWIRVSQASGKSRTDRRSLDGPGLHQPIRTNAPDKPMPRS